MQNDTQSVALAIAGWVAMLAVSVVLGAESPDTIGGKAPVEFIEMSYRGISLAVRSLPPVTPETLPERTFFDLERADREKKDTRSEGEPRYAPGSPYVPDGMLSPPISDGDGVAPNLLFSFEGLSSIIVGPPDTEGAVGPGHYVQAVNIQFRIFDKLGTPLTEPALTSSLWLGSGGACETDVFADAVIAYDRAADRWLIAHLVFDPTQNFVACIAVSTSGDPTGHYSLYELAPPLMPDYPKIGVWPDPVHNAYVMTTILTNPLGHHDVFALDRERLLAGVEPRPALRFSGFPSMLLPADLDGTRRAPDGSPALLYTVIDGGSGFFVPPSPVDTLKLYEMSIDWDDPSSSSVTMVQSFSPPVLGEFNWTICGWNVADCLPQPGTDRMLDTVSFIPMQRFQYRNLNAYETLVGTWTVNAVAEGKHAAPRWFELRRANGSDWTIAHQGTFAPDSTHRWMPSIALDGSGNMAMVYNAVNADSGLYPSLYYTTRPVDESHFLTERNLAGGRGPQTGTNRWGDYASMEVDPVDDCTFWFTGEYMPERSESGWSTRIGVLRVPGCTGEIE